MYITTFRKGLDAMRFWVHVWGDPNYSIRIRIRMYLS